MRVTKRWAPCLLVILATAGFTACGGEHQPEMASDSGQMARIEGTVLYRERMMLPPGVEVEVQLQDVSRADAMATVLASVLITPQGAPPYDFAIEYDPAKIDSRLTYALRATIARGDRLLFSSTDYIDPFQGNPVEVLVRRVPDVAPLARPALEGVTWTLQTLAGEPAATGADGTAIDIHFNADEQRVAGFSGCNRYAGGYKRDGVAEQGSPLKFGPLAGTMMACEVGGELEWNYLQALGRVTAFRLDGDTLSLLSGSEVLATFKST